MPKRKHDLDYYLKKLRSLEKSIIKRKKEGDLDVEQNSPAYPASLEGHTDDEESDLIIVPDTQDLVTQPSTDPTLPPAENVPSTSTAAQTTDTATPTTNPEVLLALGDLMPDKPAFGPPINNDLARIWSTILKNGIPKEKKENLLEKLIPENCSLLKAPKLNPEIIASISDTIINRDKKIESEQKQLSIGLAIISTALSSLIDNETVDRLKLISVLSEAGRVLTDLHYTQTKSRKTLIFPVLDKKFLDVIKDVERDEYLYGTNLNEKIKSLQSVQRSGKTIKKVAVNPNRQGNSSGPPRFTQQKTMMRSGQKKVQSSTYQRKYQGQQYQHTAKKMRAPPAKQPAARP